MKERELLDTIKYLRKLLRPEEVIWRRAKATQMANSKIEIRLKAEVAQLKRDLTKTRDSLATVRKGRDEWRRAANRYQRLLRLERDKG